MKSPKIQETSDSDNPFYSKTGEVNLSNVLFYLFIAGSDTTANTLAWAMLFMILNSDVQTKVWQELNQNFGNKKAKMAEKHKIPYTEAVIHEIQRMANVLPLSVFHNSQYQNKCGFRKVFIASQYYFYSIYWRHYE